MMVLDLSGKGKASNLEIDLAADNIFGILKDFDSPKDAGSAFCLAHFRMICAAFPPENNKEAIDAVETHCRLLIEFIREGWQ